MATTFFVMQRNGIFIPKNADAFNACKAVGWSHFHYFMTMVFPGNMQLNSIQQIVDHAYIDKTIQAAHPSGSCEEMHLQVEQVVLKFMRANSLPLLASKCLILPELSQKQAYMGRIWIGDHPAQDRIGLAVMLNSTNV